MVVAIIHHIRMALTEVQEEEQLELETLVDLQLLVKEMMAETLQVIMPLVAVEELVQQEEITLVPMEVLAELVRQIQLQVLP